MDIINYPINKEQGARYQGYHDSNGTGKGTHIYIYIPQLIEQN